MSIGTGHAGIIGSLHGSLPSMELVSVSVVGEQVSHV